MKTIEDFHKAGYTSAAPGTNFDIRLSREDALRLLSTGNWEEQIYCKEYGQDNAETLEDGTIVTAEDEGWNWTALTREDVFEGVDDAGRDIFELADWWETFEVLTHAPGCSASLDWKVEVYNAKNEVVESWAIEDRTADEAIKEAEADIENRMPAAHDWTLSATEKHSRTKQKFEILTREVWCDIITVEAESQEEARRLVEEGKVDTNLFLSDNAYRQDLTIDGILEVAND